MLGTTNLVIFIYLQIFSLHIIIALILYIAKTDKLYLNLLNCYVYIMYFVSIILAYKN